MTEQTSPAAQAKYQVRFDWGTAGATAIGQDADVVVLVDALPPTDADAAERASAALITALPESAAVLSAGLTTASAAARWILDEQVRLGRRALVSLVAAGSAAWTATPAPGLRFAVEDQLAAGAIIDALATLGIDYSSPEAAVACAAFTGLRRAVGHLLTASVSGQEQLAGGRSLSEIGEFGRVDSAAAVTVLRASSLPE
ncbi:MAG TPA: hypothetical protein VGN33_13650 [Leifsonia sp.]|nr:hypothetical protein [Leifsonia sp.]